MNGVQGPSAATSAGYLPVGAPAAGSTSLLPEPASGADLNDAMTMLMTLLSKQGERAVATGKSDIETAEAHHKELMRQAQEAYKKMKEAENNPFGFLGDLFKVVFAVAATVVSGGAAVPALAGSAMAFSAVVKQTQCFGELSNVMATGADLVGSCGVGNAFLIAGDGTSLTGAVGAETKAFDEKAVLALNVTGQILKCAGQFGTSAGMTNGDLWATYAGYVKGAALLGSMTANIGHAVKDGEAAQAAIDMKQLRMQMGRLERLVDDLIDGVRETHESHNKAVRAVEGAIATNNQTAVAAASGIRG